VFKDFGDSPDVCALYALSLLGKVSSAGGYLSAKDSAGVSIESI
jgi:hypothetical protein